MGIEIRRWPVEPDMYDMSPATKNGIALQAFDTSSNKAAGNLHIVPNAIPEFAVEPVVLIASYALRASAAAKSVFKH